MDEEKIDEAVINEEVVDEEKCEVKKLSVKDHLRSAFKFVFSKDRARAWEIFIFGLLQYVFLPVLCGFITAGILTTGILEKVGLAEWGFANFPTIKMQSTTSSTYDGLMLAAGLGCILGLLLSRFLKFGARLGHFNFISPLKSQDELPVPSPMTFVKAIIRFVGVPIIVVLGAMSARELAIMELLPIVIIDTKYQAFEVTLSGVVVISATGCLIMYLYDFMLSTLLRMGSRKDVEIKEMRLH